MMIMDRRCSICGDKLLPEMWLVGGPLSAFLEQGAYNDPPMHRDCLHYALRVCPYMLLSRYGKRIDARTVKDDTARVFINNDQAGYNDRPTFFVAVGLLDFETSSHGRSITQPFRVIPHKPFRHVEFWRDGKQYSEAEAMPIIRPIVVAEQAHIAEMMENLK